MVTGISFLVFIAFYLLYGTSKKMTIVDGFGFEKWIAEHTTVTSYFGLALLIISLGLSCFYWGWGSGVLVFFILLMSIASLIILLVPLRLINYASLLSALILCLFIETILF